MDKSHSGVARRAEATGVVARIEPEPIGDAALAQHRQEVPRARNRVRRPVPPCEIVGRRPAGLGDLSAHARKLAEKCNVFSYVAS